MIQCGINAGTTTLRSINHSGTGLAMQANDTGNSWDKPCIVSPVNFLCLFLVSSWLPAVSLHLKQPFLVLNSFLPYEQSSAGHWLRKGANPWQGNSISQSMHSFAWAYPPSHSTKINSHLCYSPQSHQKVRKLKWWKTEAKILPWV